MIELGIILIGTGIIIFFSAFAMLRSTNKTMNQSRYYNIEDDVNSKADSKTEKEFSKMVKRTMYILYAVGGTCVALGFLFVAFSG